MSQAHHPRPALVPVWLAGIALLACAVFGFGCSGEPPRKPGPVRIVVTIPPLLGLAKALVPDDAAVTALIPPGRSEHGYELTPRDISTLAEADVVVYVGLGLEPQVEAFVHRTPSKIREDVCFATVVKAGGEPRTGHDHGHGHDHGDHDHAHHDHGDHDHEGHDHGDDGHGHDHSGSDPHLWLDPALVKELVPSLAAAIDRAMDRAGALTTESRITLAERKNTLLADIDALDAELKGKLAPLAGQAIVTHHAAWERFAGHYGLTVAAVIRPIETAEPAPAAVEAAIEAIRERGVRAIFVEPQFNAAAAERIAAAAGVRVGTIDPLGDGDWFKMMRSNAEALVKALGE